MREGRANNLLDALSDEDRIPLTRGELDALIGNPIEFTGDAREQVARIANRIEVITKKFPTAATYKPGSIR